MAPQLRVWLGHLDCKGTTVVKFRFGYFIDLFHRAGTNSTFVLQWDVGFIEHLDAFRFDEVWLNEHHLAGSETISAPNIFTAVAAQRRQVGSVW